MTTVQTGTVTGDLYVSGNPPSTSFTNVVDRTFTLPAAAVAGPGRVKWARLYVSSYCGHMQDAKKITYATKVDWNNDGTWDNTWTETDNPGQRYNYVGEGGNDNSEFAGHSTGEPYLMLNDHTTRVTSDYLSLYDVTNLIQVGQPTIKVNVDATGSYDGRIKVIELVVAYDDPSSTTETRYWVNEGHDSCSYYIEDNEDTVAVGTTTFDTSGLSGITSARLTADYMASTNGYYGFPTADNNFIASAKSGSFTNIGLDNGQPDAQGPYSGIDSWDVTSSVSNNNSVTFAYARYLPASGLAQFYKIPLAFLVVKKPIQSTPAPNAEFIASVTSGTTPLTVQFTDQSTGSPTSWKWDFNNDGTVDSTEQTPQYTYSAAGTYTVNLTVTGPGGSDSEVKTGYVSVTAATTNDLSIAGAVNPQGSTVFAKEANTVSVVNVKNTGSAALANISVALYASDVSGGTVPVNTTTIASLAGGGQITVTIIDPTIRNLEGTLTYTACVDPDNLIAETNEANNNKTVSKSVKYNGYKGKGLYWEGGSNITTKHTYDLQGNLLYYTQPDSAYKGVGWTTRTETWTTSDIPVPSGSTLEKVFLYVAYNWDQTPGGYPKLNVNFNGNILDNGNISKGNGILYTDMSNFGSYPDYEYGLYVYDVTDKFNPAGNSLVITPLEDNKNALYPSTLVVIYRNSNETRKQIFINEECDELGLSASYGTIPEEATAYAPFTGMSIDKSNVKKATLYSFAGSAGPDEGNLLFNGNLVASNAWQGSANTASPLVLNATNYISETANEAGIQSTTSGGMDALQQILVVEYPGETVPVPVANFTSNVASGTAPLTVQFTDSSTGTVSSYAWDFNNDGTVDSTEQSPSYTYSSSGTYTVNLTVAGPGGSDSEVKAGYIVVNEPQSVVPVANFTATPLVGTAPLSVTFTDQSTNSPTSWKWEYNNGSGWVQFSTEKDPTFSFATACPYDIRLTATNSGGSDEETKLHYIAVATGREPLVTVQSGNVSGDLYLSSPTTWVSSKDAWVSHPELNLTFNLPAAAVGNIQWAKMYVNTYSGSAGNNYALISTVRLDGNGDSTFETTLGSETMDIASENNANSYPLNDHVNKVFSDYEAQYDVTSLISAVNPAVNIKEQAISGKSLDGRIKGVTLVVAYNDPSSTDHTYYWVNHGDDWISNSGSGQTTFNTEGLSSGWISAESKIRQVSTKDVTNYTFNGLSKTGGGSTPNYDGLNTWDVTNNITAGQSSVLTYSNPAGSSYKATLATLKVKYVAPVATPTANFTAAPTSGNSPLTVQFTDTSTGTVSSYAWDFNNDGTVDSTQQSPLYTYSTIGNYTVNLTVTGPDGSDSEVKTEYIAVNEPVPAALVAAFTATPTSGIAPLTVNFTDQSTGMPTSWFWDFGDGKNTTGQNVSYTYTSAGIYIVNLTVSNSNGTNSASASINVSERTAPVLPIANFSTNVSEGYAPFTVQCTDLSENSTSLSWDFGDGSNSTEQNPIHTYTVVGNYSVNLTVSNENGTSSRLAPINVLKQPSIVPVANFSSDVTEGFVPLSVQFSDLSKDATGWNWDFGDGANSTEQNPVHVYNAVGKYSVTLTASNEAGMDVETKTGYITVKAVSSKLVAAFSASPTSGNAPLKVEFTDRSTGSPTSWKWSFGDGTYSTARNPVHTYSKAGKYTVSLTVKNAKESSSVKKSGYINVANNLKVPVAAFSASPTSGNAPLKVQFTDKSKGSPTSWKWSFGDGTYSAARNPVHTYSKAGKYTVSLTVKNRAGKSMVTGFNYIKVAAPLRPPVAAFSAYPTSGKTPLKVTFVDKSTGYPTSWKWSFGDGTYSAARNPVHTYSKTGKYTVSLTTKNTKGSNTKKIYGYINVSRRK